MRVRVKVIGVSIGGGDPAGGLIRCYGDKTKKPGKT
jgi:hypothetical protein